MLGKGWVRSEPRPGFLELSQSQRVSREEGIWEMGPCVWNRIQVLTRSLLWLLLK